MRSRDRLTELRQRAAAVTTTPRAPPGPHHDQPAREGDARELHDLLTEVERVHAWVADMESNTRLMRALHADAGFHSSTHLQEQCDVAATRSAGAGLKLCAALRELEHRALSAAMPTCARAARMHLSAARSAALGALQRHYAALQDRRDLHRALLHKHIQIAALPISEEECEALLDRGDVALFTDDLQARTSEARRALREAEARRGELARVEASLAEVHDLFLQLAALVEMQHDAVLGAAELAHRAHGTVRGGRDTLASTHRARNKLRSKKTGLIVCVASGALVVLLVLVLT